MAALQTYQALAQSETMSLRLRSKVSDLIFSEKSNQAPDGWWPFLTSNLGLFSSEVSDQNQSGYSLQFKGTISYYDLMNQMVVEGGLGVQTADLNERQVSSPLIDLAGRYQFAPRWEAGPAATFFIGNGDRYGSSSNAITTFAGASVLHRIPLENGDLLRLGARLMTDVGIPNQAANLFLFEVHWSFGGSKVSRLSQTSDQDQLWQDQEIQSVDPLVRSGHLASRALARWRAPQMAYSTRQVEPNSIDKSHLTRLAQEFRDQPELAQKIRVIGHADERGSSYSNLLLSRARAQAAANILILAGVPQSRVEVIARGSTQPISQQGNSMGWDQNRRVEIELIGVTRPQDLQELFRD